MVPRYRSPGVTSVRTVRAYQPTPAVAIMRPQVWRRGMYIRLVTGL